MPIDMKRHKDTQTLIAASTQHFQLETSPQGKQQDDSTILLRITRNYQKLPETQKNGLVQSTACLIEKANHASIIRKVWPDLEQDIRGFLNRSSIANPPGTTKYNQFDPVKSELVLAQALARLKPEERAPALVKFRREEAGITAKEFTTKDMSVESERLKEKREESGHSLNAKEIKQIKINIGPYEEARIMRRLSGRIVTPGTLEIGGEPGKGSPRVTAADASRATSHESPPTGTVSKPDINNKIGRSTQR